MRKAGSVLSKAPLKQRAWAQRRERAGLKGETVIAEIGKMPKFEQKDTDYGPIPNWEKMTLKQRAATRTTTWPTPNRNPIHSNLPSGRNNQTVWRRLEDGSLCRENAVALVRAAVKKLDENYLPLNEFDSVILQAVWPEMKITNLPKDVVESKGFLTPQEKNLLKEICEPPSP